MIAAEALAVSIVALISDDLDEEISKLHVKRDVAEALWANKASAKTIQTAVLIYCRPSAPGAGVRRR